MIVDANVWVNAVVKHDTFYQRSRHWLRLQEGANVGLYVPALAVVEVAGAIARIQNSSSRGRHMVKWMQRSPNIEVLSMTDALIERAAEITASHQFRGSDAVYVATAAGLSASLVTWDNELRERAASVVSVIQPRCIARSPNGGDL